MYDVILIRFGELMTKGKNRKTFISILSKNIKNALQTHDNLEYEVQRDRMFIYLKDENTEEIIQKLTKVFGISSFSLASTVENDIEKIKEKSLEIIKSKEPKTFKVSARRNDKSFPINSMELNPLIGSYILTNTENIIVDVKNPEVELLVEIRNDKTYIMHTIIKGLGGHPVGTGGKVLILMSGGIDSPVAAYLAMKRGMEVELLHFASPPYTSEDAMNKVRDLTKEISRYSSNQKIKLTTVNFSKIQEEINEHVQDNYIMTITRRHMMRVAKQYAEAHNILAIGTGESLGQVASQTIESMHTINDVINLPVIRPLITMDKLEIIDIAEKINTYIISIKPYDDACTVFLPKNPATKPKVKIAEKNENYNYQDSINNAIENIEYEMISYNSKKMIDSYL